MDRLQGAELSSPISVHASSGKAGRQRRGLMLPPKLTIVWVHGAVSRSDARRHCRVRVCIRGSSA